MNLLKPILHPGFFVNQDIAPALHQLIVDKAGLPDLVYHLVCMLLIGAVMAAFVSLSAFWLIYMERKCCAYFQQRIGPNRVGPWGLLQTIADALKLLQKEDLIPEKAD